MKVTFADGEWGPAEYKGQEKNFCMVCFRKMLEQFCCPAVETPRD